MCSSVLGGQGPYSSHEVGREGYARKVVLAAGLGSGVLASRSIVICLSSQGAQGEAAWAWEVPDSWGSGVRGLSAPIARPSAGAPESAANFGSTRDSVHCGKQGAGWFINSLSSMHPSEVIHQAGNAAKAALRAFGAPIEAVAKW